MHNAANTLRLGPALSGARGTLILLHGRGSSARDIAGLADFFDATDLAILVPQAADHTWYPHRFLVPPAQNEPALTSALTVIDTLVRESLSAGLASERIALAGFSQGACLAFEYAARHPRRYAFVAGLSGALIGPTDTLRACGDLERTPVLVACSEHDAHIPREHVEHSAAVLSALNADVTRHIFPGDSHTLFPEEIDWLRTQTSALSRPA